MEFDTKKRENPRSKFPLNPKGEEETDNEL